MMGLQKNIWLEYRLLDVNFAGAGHASDSF